MFQSQPIRNVSLSSQMEDVSLTSLSMLLGHLHPSGRLQSIIINAISIGTNQWGAQHFFLSQSSSVLTIARFPGFSYLIIIDIFGLQF